MSNRFATPNFTAIRKPSSIADWSEPPARAEHYRRTRSTYHNVVAELMVKPGTWARLDDRSSPSGAYQFAQSVAAGRMSAFRPEGAFESAQEGCSVWVRYLGDPDGDPVVDLGVDVEGDDPADAHDPTPEYHAASEDVESPDHAPDPRALFAF